MKRIVIIGSSPASLSFIEQFRQSDQESTITLFTSDNHWPYDRWAMPEVLSKSTSWKETYWQTETFFQKQKVDVIKEETITRINTKRQRIYTNLKRQVEYDILVITDAQQVRNPKIRGGKKSGVFSLGRLDTTKMMLEELRYADTVAINAETLTGLQAALSFVGQVNEVILVTKQYRLLEDKIDQESSEIFKQLIESSGVRVILNSKIDEILGDSDAKAIRLDSGKVYAAEMIVFDDLSYDLRNYGDNDLEFDEGVLVNDNGQTSMNNVYALDKVGQLRNSSLKRLYAQEESDVRWSGQQLAAQLTEQSVTKPEQWEDFSLKAEKFSAYAFGITQSSPGVTELSRFDAESNKYKRIFVKEGLIAGAILINGELKKDKIVQLAKENVHISGSEESVLEDNLSFETIVKERESQHPSEIDQLEEALRHQKAEASNEHKSNE